MMNLNFLDQTIKSLQQKVTDLDKKLGWVGWSKKIIDRIDGISHIQMFQQLVIRPPPPPPPPTIEDGSVCLQPQTDDRQTGN